MTTQSVPPVSADAIRRLVLKGAENRPELATRLEKAAMIVLFRTVALDGPEEHLYHVESESQPGRFYTVNGECDCQDYTRRAPGGLCKHRLAVALVERADDDARLSAEAREAIEAEWLAAATVQGY